MNRTKIEELLDIIEQADGTIRAVFDRQPLIKEGPEHEPLPPSDVDVILSALTVQIRGALKDAIEELLN